MILSIHWIKPCAVFEHKMSTCNYYTILNNIFNCLQKKEINSIIVRLCDADDDNDYDIYTFQQSYTQNN